MWNNCYVHLCFVVISELRMKHEKYTLQNEKFYLQYV